MPNLRDSATTSAEQAAWFTTTHWSIVINAQDPASPQASQALEKLCRSYWYPLYAFVRRQGRDEATAKDLTQGFFAKLLEKNYLAGVRPEKGRFRNFLLASIKHFISDEWDKARALKRGGGQTIISLDETTGEDRYRQEPVEAMDAEKLYERRWALTLLEQARERLKEEFRAAGKAETYEQLQRFESGDTDAPAYAEVAPALGLSESGLRTAVHRMRQRNQELVREEVAQTVSSPAEVDEEIRYLIRVVSG
ncbi:MAG TPA: sigma-70 family RNA polymerase sigma factor [Dongiaceae bacterium]|nr:sigma-70 family RNA polymerase sigma factor [Dongiaceae bacterium]